MYRAGGLYIPSKQRNFEMDIHLINQRLADLFGKDFLNQPIYRIIWSDEIEKRFSYFEDYVPGTNVLIRRVQEVRECKKYAFLDKPQYVLEKLFFNQHNTEILDNKTLSPRTCTYEPMWCFGHEPNGRPRKPIWRAVELLMMAINNPSKLTPSQMKDAEMKQALEDEKIMLELLNKHIKSDPLHSAIKDGDAVMLNQDYKPEKLESKA